MPKIVELEPDKEPQLSVLDSRTEIWYPKPGAPQGWKWTYKIVIKEEKIKYYMIKLHVFFIKKFYLTACTLRLKLTALYSTFNLNNH